MIRRTSTKPKAARSRRRAALCSGSTSAMARAGYRRGGSSPLAPQVPVHPAAPELELIDLALAEVFALGLKAQWDLEGRRPGAPPCVRSTEDAVAAFTASQYRQSG